MGNQEVILLKDLTVDKFCDISNFREIVENYIDENNFNLSLQKALETFFNIFKLNPEQRDSPLMSKLELDFRFILETNVITTEEEEELTSSFVKFQRNSNINRLLLSYVSTKSCREWFLMYKNESEMRKKLIFKNLVYFKVSPSVLNSKTSSSINLKRTSTLKFTNDQKRSRLDSSNCSNKSSNFVNEQPVAAQFSMNCVTPISSVISKRDISSAGSNNSSSTAGDSIIYQTKEPDNIAVLVNLLSSSSDIESVLRKKYHSSATDQSWSTMRDNILNHFVMFNMLESNSIPEYVKFKNDEGKQAVVKKLSECLCLNKGKSLDIY